MVPGKSEYSRETRETRVSASLNLYGTGEARVDTGLGCLDHMVHLFEASLLSRGKTFRYT